MSEQRRDFVFRRIPQDEVVGVRYGDHFFGKLIRSAASPSGPVWADDALQQWLGTPFSYDGPMHEAMTLVSRALRERWPDGPEGKRAK